MFDFWPVYSGERFRASWPSCFFSTGIAIGPLNYNLTMVISTASKNFCIISEGQFFFGVSNPELFGMSTTLSQVYEEMG